MIVQNIYYSLSISICVRLKIASHLTHLETKVTCSSLQTCVCVAETCLHLVNDVLLPKLILVAHLDNVLLCLAAAVLQCRCKVSVSEINSVDNSFCRIVKQYGTRTGIILVPFNLKSVLLRESQYIPSRSDKVLSQYMIEQVVLGWVVNPVMLSLRPSFI